MRTRNTFQTAARLIAVTMSALAIGVAAAVVMPLEVAVGAPLDAPAAALIDKPIPSAWAQRDDGCRGVTGDPWVYVGKTLDGEGLDGKLTLLRGMVTRSRVSREELFTDHEYADGYINHDGNYNVKPDAGYRRLLGTGNLGGEGEEQGTVEVEAATGQWAYQNHYYNWQDFYPTFAWPAKGDWVEEVGPLIWDCYHGWSNHTERTEIHPPNWVHVERADLQGVTMDSGQQVLARVHDLYANSNRQKSGMIAQRHKSGVDQRHNPDVWQNGEWTFYLRAPTPKPAADAQLACNDDAQLACKSVAKSVRNMTNAGSTSVTPYPDGKPGGKGREADPGIEVTVSMSGAGDVDEGYAARWYVGWDKGNPSFKKVKVTFTRVRCWDDSDPLPWPLPLGGPGEFHLNFRSMADYYYGYDSGLNSCDDSGAPGVVYLSPRPTMTELVPVGKKIVIEAGGYENDDPTPGDLLGSYTGTYALANRSVTKRVSGYYDVTFNISVQ